MDQSDYEMYANAAFDEKDFDELRQEEYVATGLDAKFQNFHKLTELAGVPRLDMGNTHLHIGLQHLIKELRDQATTKYHFDLCLEAASRCMDFNLLADTVKTFRAKGYDEITQEQLAPLVRTASFRRNPQYLDGALKILAEHGFKTMEDYSKEVIEYIVMYHEIMAEYDTADKIFAEGIKLGKLNVPWKHQRHSHINAKKFAQKVPSRKPHWDEPTPEADIIHLEGSNTLLSRVKLRYACYSFQDMCENNGTVHPKINIPHNIVVQSIVRGKNNPKDPLPYHGYWSPMQQEVRDYLRKFGIPTQHISRAANLFWIDHMHFDRLPTPGNQNPAKKPEFRPFRTEGWRETALEVAAEEAEKQRQREARAAALGAGPKA
eukprot:UN01446